MGRRGGAGGRLRMGRRGGAGGRLRAGRRGGAGRALGALCALAALAAPLAAGCRVVLKTTDLVASGNSRELRKRDKGEPPNSPGRPPLLVIGLDGVGRRTLYDMLRRGEMPRFAELLGGQAGGKFPHAHLDDRLVATMPSSTIAAWTTAFTGVGPARHGVAGNEFFVREERAFEAPSPTTFNDPASVLSVYTDSALTTLRRSPTVYERMREKDPHVLVWAAMHPVHAGADRLLVTTRTALVDAFEAFAEEQVDKRLKDEESEALYETFDKNVVRAAADELDDDGPLPDVLAVYLSGADLFAHVAEQGPERAQREYMKKVLDPLLGRLTEALKERGALANRYVLVTADHGHTEVLRDDAHALAMEGDDDPPALLRKAGFRLRPFKVKVDRDDDFQAVLAYQGAVAYVYLADRSTCEAKGKPCDWTRPPRFREDVLALADAFHRNNLDGSLVPAMRGTLDLVLAREPRPAEDDDLPFQVYVGGGRLQPLGAYLAEHPHPTYVDLEARLADLAVGRYGERAGDVLLVAHNGDRDRPQDRFYFSATYRSWHGSPSRQDSEIPLIVAHPGKDSAALAAEVSRVLGDRPAQQKFADVMLALRGLL
ncbi:MAG TPA: alkaline phosphatase family protein [Polyangiaceae bacterium]|nr:alkaline phosphatase family protein [Polyangiaceae bacterium]